MPLPSPTRMLRSTAGTVLTLLAAVTLVVVVAVAVALVAPDGDRDLRAYEAAQPCPSAPAAPAECRWIQEFTVSDIHLTSSRGERNRAVLTDADGTEWETTYSSKGPVLNQLDEGDRVSAILWRGRLVEIAAEGRSQDTAAAPADMRARILVFALITVPPALLVAVTCVWRLSRRDLPEPARGMAAALGLAVGLFFVGLFSPLLVGDRAESFWAVAAVWAVLAAIAAFAAYVYATCQEKTSDTEAGQTD